MNFGKRMREIRLQRGLTLIDVAEKLGKTEATIQRYESGNIKNLKSDTIEELAAVLKVEPSYLMGWGQPDKFVMTSEYDYYPVSVAAGLPSYVDGVKEEHIEKIALPDSLMGKWAGSDDIFLMRVNGESMNKSIPNGSLIAVKKVDNFNLKNGDIVVYSNQEEYSVKKFYYDRDWERIVFRPHSDSPEYFDQVVDHMDFSNIKVYGKVVVYIVELD